MDIKYNRPGFMEIILDAQDADLLETRRYTMARDGLVGSFTKTHVRVSHIDGPSARLDGDADVTVTIPQGATLSEPLEFARENIGGFGKDLEGRLNHYFGQDGGVRIVSERPLDL